MKHYCVEAKRYLGRHVLVLALLMAGCSGNGAQQAEAETLSAAELIQWTPGLLSTRRAPVDLSYLNHKPAGSKGPVRVEGDGLVFGDGSPARFWGTNIAAYALFEEDKAVVEAQARRIAQLGHNLVRIHHHDSTRWVRPTVIDQSREDSRHLDSEAMAQLDYLIHCLREEGVYIWLDLHVGRQLKPGDVDSEWGHIEGFEEIARKEGSLVGFNYYNKAIQGLMVEFNAQYLSHVNAYTGLAYKDDPAIMGLLITNENDLTTHFGNLMLPDKDNPVHNALFDASVRAFAETHGLPYNRTWRTWEPGPSKIYLNHQESRFNRRMLDHLRDLGVTAPIATTNQWGNNSLFSLPALTMGDVIDAHSYGSSNFLQTSPHDTAHFGHWIAAAQVYGMPLTVTEWNVPHPAPRRFTAPLYVAALASLQSWDAMMLYNYTQQGLGPPINMHKWSTWSDPALTALMPAAALAYREGHIRPAEQHYCLLLDREQLFYNAVNPERSAALRSLAEQHRLSIGLPGTPELPWLQPTEPGPEVTVIRDPNQTFLERGQMEIHSDTGELYRNWEAGYHTVNTEKTQAAAGALGGRRIELDNVTVMMQTPHATVAVSSLDTKPIAASERLLITVVARTEAPDGRLPFRSEPMTGALLLRANPGLAAYALDGATGDRHTVGLSWDEDAGGYHLNLEDSPPTHWYLLETTASKLQ